MDKEQIKNHIAEYYAKLPPKAQEVFANMQWINILRSLSKKYNLNQEQIATLGTETTLVLLSLINKEEYKKMLIDEIKISQVAMVGLVKDIEDSILNPISKLLEEAYSINIQVFDDEIQQTLDERFDKLPENVKNAIKESEYRKKLYNISIKYKLPVDEMGVVENITVDLIVGKISPSQYENKLSLESDINPKDAHDIAIEVNEEIMKKIRDNMKMSDEIKKQIVEEDEVPIPPYKENNTGINEISLSHTENTLMKDSGVDLDIDTIDKEDISANMQEIVAKEIPKIQEEEKIAIKNEPTIGSIIGHKLNTITNTKEKVSDHSVVDKNEINNKKETVPAVKKVLDPYHEVIE